MTKRILLASLALGLFVVFVLLSSPDARACGPYCDMPGDRGGVAHYLDNAVACESACDRTQDCRGWTWVKPGVQGPRAVCWIKKEIVATMRSNCCISGYRGDRSAANSVRQFGFGDIGEKREVPRAPPPASGGCKWMAREGGRFGMGEDYLGAAYDCVCAGGVSPASKCPQQQPRR